MGQTYAGHLITLEGGEGVGKTTQQHLLAEALEKHCYSCLITREPGGTDVGQALRHLLLQEFSDLSPLTELLLFAADRAEHVEKVIRPALVAGQVVICDRFTDSTVVYQGVGRGVEQALIHQVNGLATGGLTPDLTLWLNLPPEKGLARVHQRLSDQESSDRMEGETLTFHRRLQEGFAHLAATDPTRIKEIDASGSIEQVATEIAQLVLQYLTAAHTASNYDTPNNAC